MASVKGRLTEPIPRHRILREIYRHYPEYRDYVMNHGGTGVIDYGYFIYEDDGVTVKDKIIISLSFWDLHNGLKSRKEGGILSDRKREAVFYNVILDWKQKDVAERMGITTVSVGQYVESACLALAKLYFAEDQEDDNGEE